MATDCATIRTAYAALADALAAVNSLDYTRLPIEVLLELQSQRETLKCSAKAVDHRILAAAQTQATAKDIGAKDWPEVLHVRLRISREEARRRVRDTDNLGPRSAITGEPLGPVWELVAAALAEGAINSEHVQVITWFFGKVPFPALHVDTQKKFPEMYAFRDQYAKEWGLDLKVDYCPPIEEIDPTLPPAARSAARKTEGLKLALAKYGFDGLIAGIRRDEEATRAKERVFSPRGLEGGWDVRDQPPEFWDHFNASVPQGAHLRVHPILHWTEEDIWAYTQRENIPIIPLYLSNNGKRYRSLGDQDITNPVVSNASNIEEILAELKATKIPERAGRALDHETEDAFERLRVAGYL